MCVSLISVCLFERSVFVTALLCPKKLKVEDKAENSCQHTLSVGALAILTIFVSLAVRFQLFWIQMRSVNKSLVQNSLLTYQRSHESAVKDLAY